MSQPTRPVDAQYDLTSRMAPFLDVHFLFPMIDFLSSTSMYPEKETMQVKFDLLQPTSMIDFAIEVYQQLHGTTEIPGELDQRRHQVVDKLLHSKEQCQPLLSLLENEAEMTRLQTKKLFTSTYLQEQYAITSDMLDSFYKYAKLQYECGNYQDTMTYLSYYGVLMASTSEAYMNALWGKLASEILMFRWKEAMVDITCLMEAIENKAESSPLEQLQQRTWLLHWALFIFAWSAENRDAIIDLMLQPHCMEAIQTNAPWLLRYVSAGVICHKRRRHLSKELIKILQQEEQSNGYRDPIIEFIDALVVKFDFDSAEEKLRQCMTVMASDFFLYEEVVTEFMESARIFTFEIYCSIHHEVKLSMLAKKLGMDGADAERWIVDLIRNARMNAKINSQEDLIVMNHLASKRNIYQQMMEKTKDLTARTYNLMSQVARDVKEQKTNA